MIQDIGLNRYHGEYQKKQPQDQSRILCYMGNTVLLSKEQEGLLPTYEELKSERLFLTTDFTYLFRIDKNDYFLLEGEKEYDHGMYTYCNVRSVRNFAPQELCFAISTGYQLYGWYHDNHYCGRCKQKLEIAAAERMLLCPDCGNMIYPKIAPAVIVGVRNGDKILMTKYAGREYKRYALIAGFCEIGETAEDTVRREVMEEVGLRVKNIRYYKSQPWGFDSNLLMGFFADLDGDDNIIREEKELAVAEWIDRRNTAGMNDGISLTREMIDVFSRENVQNR